MRDAWDLKCQFKEGATEVAGAVAETMIGQLADLISQAQSTLITSTVTWWLYLPPVDSSMRQRHRLSSGGCCRSP
ncbi:hypothetical protein [Salinispora arenicola]|uniref:hypothetical protein n=1 Tax=Salinispora arenicola TaxID=168697 RepID=UPI0027DBD558|nr:hypothetical protein [Salinispora arenicola]